MANPQSMTTEIEQDYPGRFVVEIVELKRLVTDISRLLRAENDGQILVIKYWVRLENGIVYGTENLEDVLNEENSRRLTICLLVIFAELFIKDKEDEKPLRRVVIQFSRGKQRPNADMLEHIGGEAFRLNYHGLNFRVRDRNRVAAMEVTDAIEERLQKFRRWYSDIPEISISARNLALNIAVTTGYVLLVYSVASLAPQLFGSLSYQLPRFTADFLKGVAVSMIGFVIAAALLYGFIRLFNWLLPRTYFEIGDEISNRKTEQKVREIVLIGIVLAAIVSIGANLATPFVASWFSR